MRIKKSFTLLEVMVSLTILALVAGALLFRARGLLDQFQSKQSLKQLMLDLRFTQQLTECYQIDIDCFIGFDPTGIILERTTDAVLPHAYQFKKHKHYRFKQPSKEKVQPLFFTIQRNGKILKNSHLLLQISKNEKYLLSSNHLTLKRLD